MKNTAIIIPTRLAARRFPNKPITKINNIPITCSHSSSMSLLPKKKLIKLAEKLSYHNINVIALFWRFFP